MDNSDRAQLLALSNSVQNLEAEALVSLTALRALFTSHPNPAALREAFRESTHELFAMARVTLDSRPGTGFRVDLQDRLSILERLIPRVG